MTDKITLGNLVNLTNQTAAITTINNNNALLTTAINNTLSRDGTPPNQMTAALDMSSNRILNLPTPISATEPLRYIDGVTAGLVGPQGPQGIPGTPGTGVVNSITGGAGITVTGTTTVPIVSNTGVVSLISGTGIGITGTTTPTITNNGVTSITAGTGIAVTGTASIPIVGLSASNRVNGPNLLPNTNWQLHSQLPGSTSSTSAFNQAGTGYQNQVTVSSFTTTNAQPTFFTSNTQQLQNGSVVTFGPGLGGLSGYGLRVIGLVSNTSFLCQLPFGAVSPGSSSVITAFPVGASDLGVSSLAADGGWTKSTTLKYSADQFAVNLCPGSKRVLNLCKGSSSAEIFQWLCPAERINEFRGRTVTFGAMVYYKAQGGTPSSQLFINDGVNSPSFSATTTGTSYNNPNTNYGHYEFLSVTQSISSSTTTLGMGLQIAGAIADVLYFATPTCKYGSLMFQDDLGANYKEHIVANTHWNPPCFVPLTTALPSGQMISGVNLFGWPGLDIEALSYCECHNSVSKIGIQAEYGSTTSGARLFIACMKGNMVPSVPLTFGLECTPFSTNPGLAVAASMNLVPLAIGPDNHANPVGVFTIFGSISSQNMALTLDFCDVVA